MVWKLLARWVVVVVLVPLIAAVIRWLSRVLEERGGPTRTSGLLREMAEALRRERARSARTGRFSGGS